MCVSPVSQFIPPSPSSLSVHAFVLNAFVSISTLQIRSSIPFFVYGCTSWTLKKTGHRKIDAFELWCWRRLLRVPWTARRSNQSILKWKEWCWSWNSNTSATWYEELTHWKSPWCWERLKAAGEGDDRGWDGWMALLTQWTWVWANSRSWWWTGKPGVLQSMGLQRVRHDWVTELNWTDTPINLKKCSP